MQTSAASTAARAPAAAPAAAGLDTAVRARHLAALGGAEWQAAAARPADRLQAALGTVAAASYAHPGKTIFGAALLTLWAGAACLVRAHALAWPGAGGGARAALALAAPTLVALLALLLLRWRRWTVAAVVLAPVLGALVWTLGAAGRLLGAPDPLLGLGVAMLLAAGVAHSGHLVDRYHLALARGLPRAQAVHVVFHHDGRGAIVAALLAVAAGLSLGVHHPTTLRACGLLLGLGLCAVLVASHALLPALLRLAPREAPLPVGPALAWRHAARVRAWIPSIWRLALFIGIVAAATTPWPGLSLSHPGLLAHSPSTGAPWHDLPLRALPPALTLACLLGWLLRDLRVACLALVPPTIAVGGLGLLLPLPPGGPAPLDLLAVGLCAVAAVGAGLHWAATAAPEGNAEAGFASAARSAAHGLSPVAVAAAVLLLCGPRPLAHLGLVLLLGLALAALGCLLAVPLALGPLGRAATTNALADARRREGLACVGLAGYAPVAAGTFGALAAMPAAALAAQLAPSLRIGIAAALAGISLWSARRWWAGPLGGDPSHPVLAGFAGSLLALLCVPWQPLWVVVAFLGFRVLGMNRPGPQRLRLRWLSQSSCLLSGDVLAGGLAGCLAALVRSWGIARGWWC